MKKSNLIVTGLILLLIALYVINPSEGISASMYGITVWASALLPALFPFFFFTRLLSELGFVEKIARLLSPITKKLYNTPGISAYVYVMSILSGYPVGAKITADLYEHNKINYGQACRITTFTSTSGPLFIIGTVGVGMFYSQKIGLIVLIAHLLGAVLNGLLYRQYSLKKEQSIVVKTFNHKHQKNVLEDAMLSSIKSIFIVGGYVALFFLIITLLNNSGILTPIVKLTDTILKPFNLPMGTGASIVNGIIEMTRGCIDLAKLGLPEKTIIPLLTGIITFGGLSIHMQALTFLKRFNIKTSFYFLQKTTHTIISVLLSFLLVLIF